VRFVVFVDSVFGNRTGLIKRVRARFDLRNSVFVFLSVDRRHVIPVPETLVRGTARVICFPVRANTFFCPPPGRSDYDDRARAFMVFRIAFGFVLCFLENIFNRPDRVAANYPNDFPTIQLFVTNCLGPRSPLPYEICGYGLSLTQRFPNVHDHGGTLK